MSWNTTRAASVYGQRGIAIRLLYMGVAVLWFIVTRFCRCYAGRTIVLCYHGIKRNEAARFAWQVRRVAGRAIGVHGLAASSAPQRVKPAVCLTFDDAFANLLDNALPLMHELGVPACVFAVSDNLGDRPRWGISPDHPDAGEEAMTGAQLRQAVSTGFCVLGSHTCTHPALAEIPMAAVVRELEESRQRLAELVGQPVDDLALPHGSFTPAVIDAAFAAGYQRVYTVEPTPHTIRSGGQVIGRFLMSPNAWRIEFLLTCAGAYSWLHLWRRMLRRLRRRSRPAAPAEPVSA
jgi:peptidoglycan/xylan/chitin deacetylase (PgdA/CDA1 family)